MISREGSVNSLSSLNQSLNHNTTTITAFVDNTTSNNNVVRSEIINSYVGASTSYDVNNNMSLQWPSEYPPGYRFCPKDEELIYFYLKRRIFNCPLPHDKIKDVNLYSTTPIKLSEEYDPVGENDWYFFTPRDRKYKNGVRPNRAAGDGYWKATGADRDILNPCKGKEKEIIGHKKALVFYEGKSPKGTKTNWIMHEYRISNLPARKRLHDSDMRLDDCVLCKIYNKNEKSPKGKNKLEIKNEPNQCSMEEEEAEEEEEGEEEAEEELVAKDENLPPEEAQLLYNPRYEDAMEMGLYEETNPHFLYNNAMPIAKKELDCIVKKDSYPPQLPYLPYTYLDIPQNGMKPIYDDFYADDFRHGFEDPEKKSSFFPSMNPLSFLQEEPSGEHNSTFFGDAELNFKFGASSNNLSNSGKSPAMDDAVL